MEALLAQHGGKRTSEGAWKPWALDSEFDEKSTFAVIGFRADSQNPKPQTSGQATEVRHLQAVSIVALPAAASLWDREDVYTA